MALATPTLHSAIPRGLSELGKTLAHQPLVVESKGKHTATVIFLHGLGATAQDSKELASKLGENLPNIKFLLPTAPKIPVAVAKDRLLPAWYNVYEFGSQDPDLQDEHGILDSVHTLEEMIEKEVENGTPVERILIGGFSQGAAVAMICGLLTKKKLGGVIGLSGFVPLEHKLKDLHEEGTKTIPFFVSHGDVDNMIRMDRYLHSVDMLTNILGIEEVETHVYPGMGHETCTEEIKDLEKFLHKIVPEEL